MTKGLTTKGQLYTWHNQIQKWYAQGSVFTEFFKQKITAFYADWQPRLTTLYDEIDKLERQYFEHEGDNIKLDENKQGIILEGKDKADFDKDWAELMNQQVAERLKLFKA